MLIHSFQQRNAIRKTWGSQRDSARVVYIVGLAGKDSATITLALMKELHAYGDVLHVDVVDTYRNNTLKVSGCLLMFSAS